MDRAAIAQVTDESDVQAIYSAEFLTDGEEVQESLGRVFDAAVAAIDDGNSRGLGGDLGTGGIWVTENDGIAVAA